MHEINAFDYNHLTKILDEYNYDYIPENITIDVKYNGLIEEALINSEKIILTADNKQINYSQIIILLKWFCNNKADIEIIDSGKYCKKCFEIYSKENFENVLEILNSKDKTSGLSVSKKIQYILLSGSKMTSKEIYDIFVKEKWKISGCTPKHTVQARCSTLYNLGIIRKEGDKYYMV